MKIIGTPNLLVKFNKPLGTLKYIKFNDIGEYETENEAIIKRLSQNFSIGKFPCKYCNKFFENKGDLLVHYRKHKEVKQ
jgi:hypothetical protein